MDALKFTGSLHKTEKKADGSIRITLDCGLDSFEAITEMERHKFFNQDYFAFACVPYTSGNKKDVSIDDTTGEVLPNP